MRSMTLARPLSFALWGSLIVLGNPAQALAAGQEDDQPRRRAFSERQEDRRDDRQLPRRAEVAMPAPRRADPERPEQRQLEPVRPNQRPAASSPAPSRPTWANPGRPDVTTRPTQPPRERPIPPVSDATRHENWGELARRANERTNPPRPPHLPPSRPTQSQPRPLEPRPPSPDDLADSPRPNTRPGLPTRPTQSRPVTPDLQPDNRRNDRPGWPADGRNDHTPRISTVERDRRIDETRRQQHHWEEGTNRRHDAWRHHHHDLHRHHRYNQYRYQQDYWRRWLAAQALWSSYRYNVYEDPFYYTPYNYRYSYGGRWHSTNHYGAELLQQAIRDGYSEGWQAGRADRMDGWRFDYRNNYGWIDGSYGYGGWYVSYDDYRWYFRQGFERGYRDGYYDRYQYGRYERDSAMILPAILGMILAFSIH